MSDPLPVSVLVLTGSWHQALHYDPLVEGLRQRGLRVVCHTHPSNASSKRALADDIEQAQYLAKREIEQERYLDVISHSYGGVVATGAFEGLGVVSRKKEGKTGGVRNMLGIATFLLPGGVSLAGLFEPGGLPPWLLTNDDGSCFVDKPETTFYHDLKEDDRQRAIRMLVPQPFSTQTTAVEKATWSEFDKLYYLKCTEDQAMPGFVQDIVIQKFEEVTGLKLAVTEIPTSHSAMYSPEAVDWAAKIVGV